MAVVLQAMPGPSTDGHLAGAKRSLWDDPALDGVYRDRDLQLVARFGLQRLHGGDDVAGHKASSVTVLACARPSASLRDLDTTYLDLASLIAVVGLAGSI